MVLDLKKISRFIMMILIGLTLLILPSCSQIEGETSLVDLWNQAFFIVVEVINDAGGDPTEINLGDLIDEVVGVILETVADDSYIRYINIDTIVADVYALVLDHWSRTGQLINDPGIESEEVIMRLNQLDIYP